MEIVRTEDFENSFYKLPQEIQNLCLAQEKRFADNWRDPRLHVKKVKELPRVFSFRITRRYRAFFYFQNTATAIIFEIDHRKDAYR